MHHEVAIQYFQATSAIIPTLAIALAVSGGVTKQEGKDGRRWFLAENRPRNIFFALGLMVLFAAGEMLSLATLATGKTTHTAMFLVLVALVVMLWLVLYNSIAPMLDATGRTMAAYAGWIAAGGVGALCVVFAAVFLVLGGSVN
ncbi:hypothetical protein [Sinomonas atrocyanea]